MTIFLVRHLNGRAGRSGWRWLYVNLVRLRYRKMILSPRFIIDGTITLPIALYGFLIFPDLPATTTAFYLTDEASTCRR
jgi:ACS family pantothenate transporter-like MFS transporter